MAALPAPGVADEWGADLNAAIESLHLTGTHSARPSTGLVTGTIYSCTDHDLIYRWDGSAWATWAEVGPTILARTDYGEDLTNATVTNGTTTWAAIDATNIALTVTVPANGEIHWYGAATAYMNAATVWGLLGILNSSNALIAGSQRAVCWGATYPSRGVLDFVETGLTPGASITRRLGFRRTGTSGTMTVEYGVERGAIQLWAKRT